MTRQRGEREPVPTTEPIEQGGVPMLIATTPSVEGRAIAQYQGPRDRRGDHDELLLST